MIESERTERFVKAKVVIRLPESNLRPNHELKEKKQLKRKRKMKTKTKTKEAELKDAERCAKVTRAVLEGKIGEKLERITEEWHRAHAMKTCIRFDCLSTQFLLNRPDEPTKKRTTATTKKRRPLPNLL